MASFEKIIPWLLYQEDDHKTPGKIVNLGDGGDVTRLGLTRRWYGGYVPASFFVDMPLQSAIKMAKIVYRNSYWNPLHGDELPEQIAAPLLSFSVNRNCSIAVKALQRVLGLYDDGVIGPVTLAEVNQKDPVATAGMFRAEWIKFYHSVVDINPNDQRFLDGWINRANFPFPSSLVPAIYG